MMESPRISVIIITYNQEDVIDRTLASLLSQKYLYEICVSDDCSRDGTWRILNEYSEKYPGIFKLHRNDPNLGIFANEEQTWTMPKGDIIYRIAGDDECCDGYFEAVVDEIGRAGIDWKNDLFCVVGDNLEVYPDGSSVLSCNRIVEKGFDPLKLKMRGLLNDRSACFSRKVLEKYIPVSRGRSFVVEEAQDDQLELFSEKFHYIPVVGNIYYSELGVSSRLSPETVAERVEIFRFFESFLESQGRSLDRYDRSYILYKTFFLKFKSDRKISNIFKASRYYLGSIDPSLGTASVNLKHLFNAIKRKLIRRWKNQ